MILILIVVVESLQMVWFRLSSTVFFVSDSIAHFHKVRSRMIFDKTQKNNMHVGIYHIVSSETIRKHIQSDISMYPRKVNLNHRHASLYVGVSLLLCMCVEGAVSLCVFQVLQLYIGH